MALASTGLKPLATALALLNLFMYIIVAALAGWALNHAIHHTFIIDTGLVMPSHYSPIFFPMGNEATGFFVIFALIASVVGATSTFFMVNTPEAEPGMASVATIAWTLTLLAMGVGCKEIELSGRNAKLRTMEAFLIILSVTQFLYVLALLARSSLTMRPRT